MKEKVFEIRGHHLRHLKNFIYVKTYNLFGNQISEKVILKYGMEFFENRENILKGISEENSLVKITAKHDDICSKCKFKVENGCLMDDVFYEEKDTAITDTESIGKFEITLNQIYTGKEISTRLLQ